MKRCYLVVSIVLLAFPLVLGAQQNATQAAFPELGSIFGEDSTLTAAEDGNLEYKVNEKGEFEFFIAEKEIRIRSAKMNLDCDRLEFKGDEQVLTATGNPVILEKGEIKGRCNVFVYEVKNRRTILKDRPLLVFRDKEGREAVVHGKSIIFEESPTGGMYMVIRQAPSMVLGKAPELKAQEKPEPPKRPIPLNSMSLDQIWEPEVAE